MTICLGKSCTIGLLCVYFMNVYEICVCASFPFGFEGGMWDLIVLIPDHCLSIYFTKLIEQVSAAVSYRNGNFAF